MDESHNHGHLAVKVKNMCKSHEKGIPTLSNLCMNVKKGTIYGLLGSSGCGKTTLLSCVVGLKKWDSGQIFLFGKKVNGTPGKRVGYMPQDVALHTPLSVKEVIEYYGQLYGMPKTDIEKRFRSLSNLLQFPSKSAIIQDLSGGQKRRISLAVTLLHRPELLILDEPTVGMDALLRARIWEHLRSIVETDKVTVIVTTHYTEETLSSDTVGVLRKGRLLTEDSPQVLLQQHGCELLEKVILKLCHADDQAISKGISGDKCEQSDTTMDKTWNINQWALDNQFESKYYPDNNETQQQIVSTVQGRITALSLVLWRTFGRHDVFLMMVLFLPTLILMLGLAILGSPPRNLKMGVINQELVDVDICFNKNENLSQGANLMHENGHCNLENLSCRLIAELSRSGTIYLIPIECDEVARQQVRLGELWGYFSFPTNYSQHVADLVTAKYFAQNETLEGSRVHLTMDMSSYISTSFVIRDALYSYEKFTEKVAIDCALNPLEFKIPLIYGEPAFGNHGAGLHEYFLPLLIQSTGFTFPMLMTSLIFINDRKLGTMNRARVAGVQFKEVMISHTITQGSVIITQTAISLAVIFLIYDIRLAGSYILFFFLCILGGFCGQALGLIIGVVFQEEVEAYMIGLLMMIVLFVMEGFFWPIEGITHAIRSILYALPTTLLIDGIRSVIFRGVGLLSNFVWPGIIITLIWTIAFWVVSMVAFRWKQKQA